MTAEERAFWLRVQQRASRLEPDVAMSIMKAIDLLQKNYSISEIARAIEKAGHGPIPPEIFPQTLLDRAFIPVSDAIADALKKGTGWGALELPNQGRIDGKAAVGFNVLDENVRAALETLDDKAIGTLEESIHETVKAVIARGLEEGKNPIDTARLLRDTIGLAPNQVDAVQNFRNALEAGSRDALNYELRDKRFDGTLENALGPGAEKSLTPEQIDKMVEAYQRGQIRNNAETNARTLSLDAMKSGQRLAMDAAVKQGILNGDHLWKRWRGTLDDREREEHLAMEGQTVPYDEPFSNGEDIPGESTYNCRCVAIYFQSDASHAEEGGDTASEDTTGFDANAATTVEDAATSAASLEDRANPKGEENAALAAQGLPSNHPLRRAARRRERERLRQQNAQGLQTRIAAQAAPEAVPARPMYIPSETATGRAFLSNSYGKEVWARMGPETQEMLARARVGFAQLPADVIEGNNGVFYPRASDLTDRRARADRKGFESMTTIRDKFGYGSNPTSTAMHETGHAIDWAWAQGKQSVYRPSPYQLFSASFDPDAIKWRETFRDEVADLYSAARNAGPYNAADGSARRWVEQVKMMYRLESRVGGNDISLQLVQLIRDSDTMQVETMADLIAAAHDAQVRHRYVGADLQKAFPKTFALIREFLQTKTEQAITTFTGRYG
jgi:hypothetical protein